MNLLKTKKKQISYTAFFIMILSNSLFAVSNIAVTVSPDSTNMYGQYTLTFEAARLAANSDSLFFIFNSSTTIPSSIDPSTISVDNTNCTAVTVIGQLVRVLMPITNNPRPDTTTVIFTTGAHIKNPSTPDTTYTIQIKTSKPNSRYRTSPNYTIYQSNTHVTSASVAPSPSIAEEAAEYDISFSLGKAGALTANDGEISVLFPSGTTIPSGSISGVTINGTSASAVSSGDTVIITTPVDLDNEESVTVKFAIGSGLENPSTSGSYTISIKTSAETTLTASQSYTISPAGQLSFSSISSKPDTVNQSGEFTFGFRTGSSGALTSNSDTIYIILPYNTYLPQDISANNITVASGGFNDNPASISINSASANNGDTVKIVPSFNISNTADVDISFTSSAGYQNPSIAGNYRLKLKTSQETSYIESNSYSILNTDTKVSHANVTAGSYTDSDQTDYKLEFSLGHYGRLIPDSSKITLSFDNSYILAVDTSYYDASTIKIADGSAVSLPGKNLTIDNTNKTIDIKIPDNVDPQNSDNIEIYLGGSSNQPITNPAEGDYAIGINTSIETQNVFSNTYTIGGDSVTIHGLSLSDSTVNNAPQYTFDVQIVNRLRSTNEKHYLKITFPEGTSLPDTIETSSITMDGTDVREVSVNSSERYIIMKPGANLGNNKRFNIVISSSANIINPIIPRTDFYKATIVTSRDKIPVDTRYYEITGDNTQVSSISVNTNPSVADADNVVYTINFTTSSTGKIAGGLAAGSSTITINFDTATVVPSTISASTVEVNSTPCSSVSVDSSGAGGVVTLNLPNGITINNSSNTTVKFTANAGLSNGSTADTNYSIAIKTSSDTSDASANYTITANQPLSVNSVSTNPTTQNANAGYSVKFTAGSSGALTADSDSIYIIFPSNTYLPSGISTGDISVNGTAPNVNPDVSGDTLKILTPVNIAALDEVTVLINQTAGILNPTLAQNYTLEVMTTAETGPFTSPTYTITSTTTTVSAADVSLGSANTSAVTNYTITFNTGANGRLIAGSSTISITFGSETTVSAAIGDYNNSTISVNGGSAVSISSSISVSSNTVTITVPSTVSIGNNDEVSISLTGSTDPITNPAAEGSYQLSVRTSVETSDVSSNSYTVSDAGPVSSVSVTLGNSMVNANSTYSISFTVDAASGALSTANGDQITITFPDNTYIPASLTASDIQVNSTSAASVSTNPSLLQIIIDTPTDIGNGASVTVDIASGAGIENPSIYGSYTLDVNTTAQPVNGTSSAYTLTQASSSLSNLIISISPETPSAAATFQFDFMTGQYGRLVSGTSKIYILFPYDVNFSLGTPATSKVTVNSTAAAAVRLGLGANTTDEDTLEITVPSSVTVGNQTDVTVIVDQSAGVENASSTSALTYTVYTSVENTELSGDYSLPVELRSFTAQDNKGKVALNWITESETNNAYWIIERSESGKDNEFKEIARIDGQGSVSSATDYEFIDKTVDADKKYTYALYSVSIDGHKVQEAKTEVSVSRPMTFELAQNYPNPFNGGTTIRFSLPKAARVKISIYNILGQKVKTLTDRSYKTGYHQINWNGRNDVNAKVSTGLYVYIMESDNFRSIKKMLYMK